MILFLLAALVAPDSVDTANQVYANCLIAKGRELDDGVSDAATVASVIASECAAKERLAAEAAASQNGASEALRGAIVAGIERQSIVRASKVILKLRSMQRPAQ